MGRSQQSFALRRKLPRRELRRGRVECGQRVFRARMQLVDVELRDAGRGWSLGEVRRSDGPGGLDKRADRAGQFEQLRKAQHVRRPGWISTERQSNPSARWNRRRETWRQF